MKTTENQPQEYAARWIPVTEKLPDSTEKVLCLMKSNRAIVGGFIFLNQDGRSEVATSPDFHFEDYENYEPTHWLPIPPAPEI